MYTDSFGFHVGTPIIYLRSSECCEFLSVIFYTQYLLLVRSTIVAFSQISSRYLPILLCLYTYNNCTYFLAGRNTDAKLMKRAKSLLLTGLNCSGFYMLTVFKIHCNKQGNKCYHFVKYLPFV